MTDESDYFDRMRASEATMRQRQIEPPNARDPRLGFSQPPAVPYADAMTQLTRRVAELERHLLTEEEHKAIYSAIERIEALEEFRKGFPDDDDALTSNPDGIRCGTFEPIPDYESKRAERERQARWWDTYNAALTGAIANGPGCQDDDEEITDTNHQIAELAADRAHGPLEAPKCTCGSGGHPRDCEKHPQGKELHALELSYEGLKDDVAELVKAAKSCITNDLLLCSGAHRSLAEAIKRFEQP
jgi:hypothetical protein